MGFKEENAGFEDIFFLLTAATKIETSTKTSKSQVLVISGSRAVGIGW